jgi:hypothetical protein
VVLVTAPLLAIRRKTKIRRRIAKSLILLALIAGYICLFALQLEIEVVGATSALFTNCGAVLEPVAARSALQAQVCADELGGQVFFALICGAIAIAAVVAGIVILIRTPKRVSF